MSTKFFRFLILFFATALSVSADAYDTRIKRAVKFLESRKGNLSFGAVVTLDLLERNFRLSIDTQNERRKFLKTPPRKAEFLLRILDDRYRVDELSVRVPRHIMRFLPTALYCDVYGVPWNFGHHLEEWGKLGGTATAWAMFSLAIFESQRCDTKNIQVEKLRSNFATIALSNLRSVEKMSPVWIDLIVGLYLVGAADKIQPTDLILLRYAQGANGSWMNDDEMTAKALWVLLMQKTGYKPGTPFEVTRKGGF
ncbi:MAG: hypothetical protein LDLANPLL_02852 [Turneriella sp.]|nr:hypothetical protein [Turneriella sp.]